MILFIGQVGTRLRGARGIPGSRLPAHVRFDRQVGGEHRPRRPHSGAGEPRVSRRHVGAPRTGGAGAARGHAGTGGRRGRRRAVPDHPDASRRVGHRRAAVDARRVRAPVRHPRRQRLDARGGRGPAALRRGQRPAGGLRIPLPGLLRQPPSQLRGRCRHRPQSEARAARARIRSGHRARSASRRNDHRRLHAAAGAAAEATARACPRRRRGTRPRLSGRSDDQREPRTDGRRARRDGAGHAEVARQYACRQCRLPRQHRTRHDAGQGRPRAHCVRPARHRAGRHHRHHRCGQLHRLGAPLLAALGVQDADLADLGRDGLRRARPPWAPSLARPSAWSSRSTATAAS